MSLENVKINSFDMTSFADLVFSEGVNLNLKLNFIDEFIDSISDNMSSFEDISISKISDMRYALYSSEIKVFEFLAERDGFKFLNISYGDKKRELSIFLKALSEKSFS
ncbi:hypothetical protein N9W84_01200 [bacterium]|nr:hypothetical protein [bacterium]